MMFELILPQNPMGKYEEKQYLEYLLKNSAEKTEDMIYVICLEYCWDLSFLDAQTGSMNSMKNDNESWSRTLQ